MSQHTPGPWSHMPASPGSKLIGVYDQHGGLIAKSGLRASAIADARLIAAAPDLLAALIELKAVMPVFPEAARGIVGMEIRYVRVIEQTQAAIAKANGGKE